MQDSHSSPVKLTVSHSSHLSMKLEPIYSTYVQYINHLFNTQTVVNVQHNRWMNECVEDATGEGEQECLKKEDALNRARWRVGVGEIAVRVG